MMKDIGIKWKKNELKYFYTYYDDKKSRDENVKNPPLSILEIEQATFINYRLKENTKVFFLLNIYNLVARDYKVHFLCMCICRKMCKRNDENRPKLKINHTGGSKKLKRKKEEIVSI